MAIVLADDGKIDPAVFSGLHQTYLVTRDETGHLHTSVADGFDIGRADEGFQFAEIPSAMPDRGPLDEESIYLLAWQTPSVTATLTGFSDGLVVGSASIEVGNDPTQVKVDWNAIDQLAISYTGTPGFPVTDNFLFL
jgi:hypothetical protein